MLQESYIAMALCVIITMTLEVRCCVLLPQEFSDKRLHFQKSAESRESICESSVPGLLNNFGLTGSAMSELRALCS